MKDRIIHTPYATGFDVSDNNGVFNWGAWRGHADFAGIKLSEGLNFIDPQGERNWHLSREIGLFRFGYHFFHPRDDPAGQAELFVRLAHTYGLEHGDNFMLDVEVTDNMHPVDVSFAAFVCAREIQKLAPNHRVLAYTFPAFADEGNCAKLGERWLWIANYGVATPEIPPPWNHQPPPEWAIWQYSASGIPRSAAAKPAILPASVGLDLDVFHGNYKQLEKFCTTTGK